MMNPLEHLVARAKARVGTVVNNKWRLDAVLGVGGMATVYAGTHRNGKRGAVKVLHAEAALDGHVKARFLREGYVANKVDHSGAVSIVDDDEAPDGTVYLVMELLEGEPLDRRYDTSRMGFAEALVVAGQLMDVLAAAHQKGIVHRDLKPGNVFLTTDGKVKVLDFGIARLREASVEATAAASAPSGPKSAMTLNAMGTPGFMAPEQARGLWDDVDARTDLWAVGATLFTLLTGRAVHEERTVNEQLLAGMTKAAPALASVLPNVPPSLAHIVDKALAYEKAERWQSAEEMGAAVAAAYEGLTGRSIDAPSPITAARIGVSRFSQAPGPLSGALRASSAQPFTVDAPTVTQPRAPGEQVTMAGAALSPAKRSVRKSVIVLGAAAAAVVVLVAARQPSKAPAGLAPIAPPPATSILPVAAEPPASAKPEAAKEPEAPPPAASAAAPPAAPPAAPLAPPVSPRKKPGARPVPAASASSVSPPPDPAPPSTPAPPAVDLYGRRK